MLKHTRVQQNDREVQWQIQRTRMNSHGPNDKCNKPTDFRIIKTFTCEIAGEIDRQLCKVFIPEFPLLRLLRYKSSVPPPTSYQEFLGQFLENLAKDLTSGGAQLLFSARRGRGQI